MIVRHTDRRCSPLKKRLIFGVVAASVADIEQREILSGIIEKAQELKESRPEYLKTVEFNVNVLNSMYFDVYLSMFGYSRADIMILPESLATLENCELYFAEISATYLGQFENLGLCEYDGKVYGLKIHDKETHSSLISCINYGEGDKEDNYYLFFGKNSLHISDLAEAENKNEWDGAIKIAQKMLKL